MVILFKNLFFKKTVPEKKYIKHVSLYVSEQHHQIIIAPFHVNAPGINYEQEVCFSIPYPVDDALLGTEVMRAFELFSFNDRNLREWKRSDWPAFKHSKLKTIKSFKSSYTKISIRGANESNINLIVETPWVGDGKLSITADISAYANKEDIGKLVMEVYNKAIAK